MAAQDTVERVTASAVAAPSLRRSLRPLGLLTGGHLVTDLAQGSVPALLPFLRTELHLSYTRTAAIMLAATIASSVVQPVFGHLFDTRRGEWLLVAGPGAGRPRHRRAGVRAHVRRSRCCACSCRASASPASTPRRASSPPGSRARGARRRCRCSPSAATSASRSGRCSAGLIASQFGLGGVWLLAIPGLAIAGAQLAGLAALGGATAHARVRHGARRARPLGRDGAAARRARGARLRALRPAHVHPAARARRAPQQPRLRLARARADALRRRRSARSRPARWPTATAGAACSR